MAGINHLFVYFHVGTTDYVAKLERVSTYEGRNDATWSKVYVQGAGETPVGFCSLVGMRRADGSWYVGHNAKSYGKNTMSNFMELMIHGRVKYFYFNRTVDTTPKRLMLPSQRSELRVSFVDNTAVLDDKLKPVGRVYAADTYATNEGLEVVYVDD